jgi:hypothetical protein
MQSRHHTRQSGQRHRNHDWIEHGYVDDSRDERDIRRDQHHLRYKRHEWDDRHKRDHRHKWDWLLGRNQQRIDRIRLHERYRLEHGQERDALIVTLRLNERVSKRGFMPRFFIFTQPHESKHAQACTGCTQVSRGLAYRCAQEVL